MLAGECWKSFMAPRTKKQGHDSSSNFEPREHLTFLFEDILFDASSVQSFWNCLNRQTINAFDFYTSLINFTVTMMLFDIFSVQLREPPKSKWDSTKEMLTVKRIVLVLQFWVRFLQQHVASSNCVTERGLLCGGNYLTMILFVVPFSSWNLLALFCCFLSNLRGLTDYKIGWTAEGLLHQIWSYAVCP